MRDNEQHAARQAMSKARPAGYLDQQIEALEGHIGKVGLDPWAVGTPPLEHGHPDGGERGRGLGRRRGRGRGWGGGVDHDDRHERLYGDPGPRRGHGRRQQQQLGRIDDDDDDWALRGWDKGSQYASSASGGEDNDGWRRAVVDVSALMWAPRRVRAMVGRGWEVVVPVEALSTLDILKKGDSQAAIAARAAARYIEHASRHFSPASAHAEPRGLRIQRDTERGALGPDADTPHWLAHVLSCVAHFRPLGNDSAGSGGEDEPGDSDGAALYIAHPPLLAEVEAAALDDDERAAAYIERAEGYRVSQEAERFELALEVLRDEEDEHPRRRKRGGGPDRGGRGGRGRGRPEHVRRGDARERDEPPREVKILLRRPELDTEQRDDEPAPASVLTPAPPPRNEHTTRTSRYEPAVPRPPPSASGSSRGERGMRGGRGRGGRGRGHGGRGRGGGGGGGGARDRNAESSFTLLTRPGPPLATHVDSLAGAGQQGVSPRLLVREPAAPVAERVTLLARPGPPVERSLVRDHAPSAGAAPVPPPMASAPRLPPSSFHPDLPLGHGVRPPAFRPTFRPPPARGDWPAGSQTDAGRVTLLERPK